MKVVSFKVAMLSGQLENSSTSTNHLRLKVTDKQRRHRSVKVSFQMLCTLMAKAILEMKKITTVQGDLAAKVIQMLG